jgi:hypothetical protein
MLGLTSREILRYQYLPARSEEIWVSLHCFFFLLNICNFYVVFYIYHFFYTRAFDRYVSITCKCGASVTSGLHKEQATSSARGCTRRRKGTDKNRRASNR